MTLTIPRTPGGLRLVEVGARRWRVLDIAGRALGQIQAVGEGADRRYRARRFRVASGSFHDIGDFCRESEAFECLRLLR